MIFLSECSASTSFSHDPRRQSCKEPVPPGKKNLRIEEFVASAKLVPDIPAVKMSLRLYAAHRVFPFSQYDTYLLL
jgi:hypothetical protein